MASTVWRGHLAFGLVSFPVRLYRAARAEKVSFRRLFRPVSAATPPAVESGPAADDAPPPRKRREPDAPPATTPAPVFRTRNAIIAEREEEPVRPEQLVKGYEYEKGQYVVLEQEELKEIRPQTSKEIQIVEFVRMEEIDPIYLETSYYLSPDEAGERPYSLLYTACVRAVMWDSGKCPCTIASTSSSYEPAAAA